MNKIDFFHELAKARVNIIQQALSEHQTTLVSSLRATTDTNPVKIIYSYLALVGLREFRENNTEIALHIKFGVRCVR